METAVSNDSLRQYLDAYDGVGDEMIPQGPCGNVLPRWLTRVLPTKKGSILSARSLSHDRQVLLEIVGAMGLSMKAKVEVDPCCIVRMKSSSREQAHYVHQTKRISNDANPVWTVATDSFCLVSLGDDIEHVSLEIYDGGRFLGRVKVKPDELKSGNGERMECPIEAATNAGLHPSSTLALRSRIATENDKEFLRKRGLTCPPSHVSTDIDFVLKSPPVRKSKKIKGELHFNITKPPPSCSSDSIPVTSWISSSELLKTCHEPSREYVSVGSGNIGRVYLEVLRADNLPNLDLGINDKTDPFVAIQCEDCLVRTDMLYDDLNPRWMPWSCRAFCFRLQHPSSILRIGVFDVDEVPLMDAHDAIGRVVMSVIQFRPGTTYTLTYPLLHDEKSGDRGTLTIRLRVEWPDHRKAMKVSALANPPKLLVNMNSDKSYQILRYLTRGAVEMDSPSLSSVKLYAEELKDHGRAFCYVLDVAFGIFLWRGRWRLGRSMSSIWFPIHSWIGFLAATLAIEYPTYIVPIVLCCIAWIMRSINYHQSRHPNPWKRCQSSRQSNMISLFGVKCSPETIMAGEGTEDEHVWSILDEAKGKRMATLISAALAFCGKVSSIYSQASMSSHKMVEIRKKWSFMGGQLHYVHMVLQLLCMNIRVIRNLCSWKNYTAAKRLTTNCVLLALLWTILPINQLVLWSLRVVVWMLLGPWMKLLDIFYVHSWYKTREELLEEIEATGKVSIKLPDFDAMLNSEKLRQVGRRGRRIAEQAVQLKAMREQMFGSRGEWIPMIDNSRVPSVPLSCSTARPTSEEETNVTIADYCVLGQHLIGIMIPTRQEGR